MTLANPIARAKYDDELQQGMVSVEMQPVTKKEHLTKIKKSVRVKTKTVPLPLLPPKKAKAENIVEETHAERLGNYQKLSAKNELAEESLEEFYSTFKTHGGKLSYNGTILQQIRKIKSVTLEELAQITCIRKTYLRAIEEENFSKFTSEIYLKGYLLCYIEALQLPKEQVLTDYVLLYKNSF